MSTLRRALYIGRFQVFHNGHVDVLRTIDATSDVEEIIIALGSPQYDHEHKSPDSPWWVNPFTAAERVEMIKNSLAGVLSKAWEIRQVPDFHDWEKWYDYIELNLPAFSYLYTSDPKERVFFARKGKEVRGFPIRFNYHAGTIRRALAAGEDIADKVPLATLAVMTRIGATKRIQSLLARDQAEKNPGR